MRPGSRSWKLADLEILRALLVRGRSQEQMAWALDRTLTAIRRKLDHLGWAVRRNRRAEWRLDAGGVLVVSRKDRRNRENERRYGERERRDMLRARRVVLTARSD